MKRFVIFLKVPNMYRVVIIFLVWLRSHNLSQVEKSDLSHHWRDIWNNMLWTVHHQKNLSRGLGSIYCGSKQMSVAPYCPGWLLFLLNVSLFYLKNEKYICIYSKALRYTVFGSRKKPCSSKPCFLRFIPMY